MDIHSRRDGPRREDVAARRLIDANRGTITRLADQLTSGGYSASKAAQAKAAQPPVPDGKLIHDIAGQIRSRSAEAEQPTVRISLNNRVIVMDRATGRQLHFLGEIRRRDGIDFLALATRDNGFFSPLDDAMMAQLGELDGVILDQNCTEQALIDEITRRMGLV